MTTTGSYKQKIRQLIKEANNYEIKTFYSKSLETFYIVSHIVIKKYVPTFREFQLHF